MTLRIISPQEVLFEGEVNSVTLPGEMGAFTVLKNHASIISSLVKGNVTFSHSSNDEETNRETVTIDGGIVVVDNNVISVCVK